MASREQLDITYLKMAKELANLSSAVRAKVGCLIVKDTHIIAEGYNGTPSGRNNCCEVKKDLDGYVELWHEGCNCGDCYRQPIHEYMGLTKEEYASWVKDPKSIVKLITKKEVIHSEMNAIAKAAKSTVSCEGATIYCTLSPCFECSKLIIQSGITKVCYAEEYRDTSGLDLLRACKITIVPYPNLFPK